MKLCKKFCLALSFMLMLVAVCTFPRNVSAAGTVRTWSVELPHSYGNYYLPFKIKQTGYASGKVRVSTMESSGVSIWFNKGTSLSDVVRITDIVKFTYPATKDVIYKSNYSKGTSVDMGIENSDSTILFKDKATGTVNYK